MLLSPRPWIIVLMASLLLPGITRAVSDSDAGWTRFGKIDFDGQTQEKAAAASILRGGWKFLKLKASNADAKIDAVTVVFTTGKDLALEFKDDVKSGEETKPLSLRGADDRPIRRVRIKAHSLQSGAKTIIEVWLKDTN